MDQDNKVKYLNSGESDIFKKQDNLFGYHQAKEEIVRQGYAVLLEGYFDVLTVHQHGLKNAVASLGTALTTNQALLLKSITDIIVVAYDGDEAGMENSFRSADVLDNVGCNVRIAQIEGELDPDEYISKYGGVAFVNTVIKRANDVKMTLIDYKKQDYDISKATDRYDYAEEILNGISKSSKTDDEQAFEKLEDVMGIPFQIMQQEIINHMRKS